MGTEVFVYVELGGAPNLVGRLRAYARKGRESYTFQYDASWLANPHRFALDPALPLGSGVFRPISGGSLFGALGDSAPDRWGRVLMQRAERHRAQSQGQTPRSLMEIDYLLGVEDEARIGALRFAHQDGGPFLEEREAGRIPPLADLSHLLAASERIVEYTDSEEDLRLLLAPGASLGGARPKASVRDHDGHLALAKFPHVDDVSNTVLWEAVALTLAAKAGIPVPEWRIERALNKPVLLLRRFDRGSGWRIPFLSAMSMLEASDGEKRSYLEFIDALRRHGASPIEDMHQLWRRIVFSILISNTDDHLRNHAFLYSGPKGWILSPAYDLNPVPVEIKPRFLSTAIDLDDDTASLDLALSVAEYFELDLSEARRVAADVGRAVDTWRKESSRQGLKKAEIDRMASAFEHEDLRSALSFS